MTRISLPPEVVAVAREWNDKILSTGLASTPNYTGFRTPERFFHGYLGELAVASCLDANGIIYRHRVSLTGRSDDADFDVWIHGEQKKLEVKTGSKQSYRFFIMPEKQKVEADIYVGARINAEDPCEVELMGALSRDEVLACPVDDLRGRGVPTRKKLYEELWSMDALLSELDRKRAIRA